MTATRRFYLAWAGCWTATILLFAASAEGADGWDYHKFPEITPAVTRIDQLLETSNWRKPLRQEQGKSADTTIYHYKFSNGDVAISAVDGRVFTADLTPNKRMKLQQVIQKLSLGTPVRCPRLADTADRGLPVPKGWTIYRCGYNVVVFTADPKGETVTRIRYFAWDPAFDSDDQFGAALPAAGTPPVTASQDRSQIDLSKDKPTVPPVPRSGSDAIPVWQFRGITPGLTTGNAILADAKWGQPLECKFFPGDFSAWRYRISGNDVGVCVRNETVVSVDLYFDRGARLEEIVEVLNLTQPLVDQPLSAAAKIGPALPADWQVRQFGCGRVAVFLQKTQPEPTVRFIRFFGPDGGA